MIRSGLHSIPRFKKTIAQGAGVQIIRCFIFLVYAFFSSRRSDAPITPTRRSKTHDLGVIVKISGAPAGAHFAINQELEGPLNVEVGEMGEYIMPFVVEAGEGPSNSTPQNATVVSSLEGEGQVVLDVKLTPIMNLTVVAETVE
ncbi:hypothetical protein DXG03_002039 [Asterophora parasitica]|uniref:Uncharacterized protein n=1 Tax=Asterophora parasitica TaxID=117018 RepID=A0A9P7FZF8_9AGAR|nr:hypothetical protein DXG03_002039 [Asterophora parasitica]